MTEQAPLPAAELAAIEERLRRRAILHSIMGGHETGVKDMAVLLTEVKRLQAVAAPWLEFVEAQKTDAVKLACDDPRWCALTATIARLERQLAEANENAVKAWGEVERLRAVVEDLMVTANYD